MFERKASRAEHIGVLSPKQPLVRGHVTQTWLQHMLFVQLKWQGTQEEGEGIIQGVIRDIE